MLNLINLFILKNTFLLPFYNYIAVVKKKIGLRLKNTLLSSYKLHAVASVNNCQLIIIICLFNILYSFTQD